MAVTGGLATFVGISVPDIVVESRRAKIIGGRCDDFDRRRRGTCEPLTALPLMYSLRMDLVVFTPNFLR